MIRRILLVANLAIANPVHADETYDACLKADQTGGGACARDWLAREETEIARQWERLLLVTEADTKAKLVAEQAAWQSFRNVACAFYTDTAAFGPEIQETVLPACLANVIGVRREQLREYVRQIDP